MSEIAAALRQFADRLDKGELLPNSTAAAIVLTDANNAAKATYIGRETPADLALIHLMARGIEATTVSKVQGKMEAVPALGVAH